MSARLIELLAVGLAEAVTRGIQIALVALLARQLGPSGLGIVGIGWTLSLLLTPFILDVPDLLAVRRLAAGEDLALWSARVRGWKLAMSALALAAGCGLALIGGSHATILQAAGALLVVAANGELNLWLLRGQARFLSLAAARAALAVMQFGLILALVHWIALPIMVPMGEAISAILVGIATGRSLPARHWRDGFVHLRAFSAEVLPLVGASLAANAVWMGIIPIAALFLRSEDVGFMAAALRLTMALNSIPQLVMQVAYVHLSKALAASRMAARRMVSALFAVALAGALVEFALLWMLAAELIQLVFGAQFVSGRPIFLGALANLVPGAFGAVVGHALLADQDERFYSKIVIAISALTIAALVGGFLAVPSPYLIWVPTALVTLQGAIFTIRVARRGLLSV